MTTKLASIMAAVLLSASAVAAHADTYTYKYIGPTFDGGTDRVAISFSTSAPLTPATSYLSTADAGIVSGVVTVVDPVGTVSGFNLPLTIFQIHTNAAASATTPGIDSWYIYSYANNIEGDFPAMHGVDIQTYSMNTMAFVPGSDIPGATGLATGARAIEKARETTYYASCKNVVDCGLMSNQPFVDNYDEMLSPADSSAANWTVTVNSLPPVPPGLFISGTLPNGTVGVAYSAALTESGGVDPCAWSAIGLPPGLTINSATGIISGTPTTANTYSFSVSAADSATSSSTSTFTVVIDAPSTTSCAVPSGAKLAKGKGKITKLGLDYIVIGKASVQIQSCTTVSGNGAPGLAVGQDVEYQGYESSHLKVAQKITIK